MQQYCNSSIDTRLLLVKFTVLRMDNVSCGNDLPSLHDSQQLPHTSCCPMEIPNEGVVNSDHTHADLF